MSPRGPSPGLDGPASSERARDRQGDDDHAIAPRRTRPGAGQSGRARLAVEDTQLLDDETIRKVGLRREVSRVEVTVEFPPGVAG